MQASMTLHQICDEIVDVPEEKKQYRHTKGTLKVVDVDARGKLELIAFGKRIQRLEEMSKQTHRTNANDETIRIANQHKDITAAVLHCVEKLENNLDTNEDNVKLHERVTKAARFGSIEPR